VLWSFDSYVGSSTTISPLFYVSEQLQIFTKKSMASVNSLALFNNIPSTAEIMCSVESDVGIIINCKQAYIRIWMEMC
jgi:hypothetical protein